MEFVLFLAYGCFFRGGGISQRVLQRLERSQFPVGADGERDFHKILARANGVLLPVFVLSTVKCGMTTKVSLLQSTT